MALPQVPNRAILSSICGRDAQAIRFLEDLQSGVVSLSEGGDSLSTQVHDLQVSAREPITYPTYNGIPPNYADFDRYGRLQLNGLSTYWQVVDVPFYVRSGGGNIPAFAAIQGTLESFQWQVNDYNMCYAVTMPKNWKEGSEFHWYAHIITNGTNVDNRYLAFEVLWARANVGSQLSVNTSTLSGDLLIPANTPSLTHLRMKLGTVAANNITVESQIFARLTRNTSTGLAPTGDPWIQGLQLYIQCDTLGGWQQEGK